jgi:2-keto-3-deoxy-L-rhamnonate aldolase RhmA
MTTIKESLRNGTASKGIWVATGSHVVAKIAGCSGFDWCLLDMEHGLGSEDDTLRQIQELNSTRSAPIVRIPANESHFIKRYLDFGAEGIMVPMIRNAADARVFVEAMRYPPRGIRGLTTSSRAARYGFDFDRYAGFAERDLLGIVQIENAEAVADCEAIAAIDGVDVLFIGHSDLSLQLGCLGKYDAAPVVEAEAKVLAACRRHSKAAGLLYRPSMDLAECARRGYTFIAMGTDIGCLKTAFKGLI